MFKITVIESGSKGNCIIAVNENNLVVLDAGLPEKKVAPFIYGNKRDNKFMFISHKHLDHDKYSDLYSLKFGLTRIETKENYKLYFSYDHSVMTFENNHDVENKGLIFIDNKTKEGFIYIIDSSGVDERVFKLNKINDINIDTIIIESNYDLDMLVNCDRPESVKSRIYNTHMSNLQMLKFIGGFANRSTKQIIITHVSKENNKISIIEDLLKEFRSKVGTDIAISITNKYKEEL